VAIHRARASRHPVTDELDILQRIRCEAGMPREFPDDVAPTVYDLWRTVQSDVLRAAEAERDPASGGTRIPRSQAWAIELLAEQAGVLAAHDVRRSHVPEALSALSAPRGPLVQRRLAVVRRQLQDNDTTPAAAALAVLEVVATEGLRALSDAQSSAQPELTTERVRLICYLVVSG
jgi:hypothetical protein